MEFFFKNSPFDPGNNEVLERFLSISRTTSCPFALKSKLWSVRNWKDTYTVQSYLTDNIDILNTFSELSEDLSLDGLVFEIKESDAIASLTGLKKLMRNFVYLLEHDDGIPLDPKKILNPNWQFAYNGLRQFLITFAPFYPRTNPRFSPISDTVYILSQPEPSFDRHIPYPTEDTKTRRIKDRIRQSFELKKQPYDFSLTDSEYEALKYVKPIELGYNPVKWWEENENST